MILFYWVIAGLSHILPRNVALFITYRIADLMYITLYRHRLPIVYKNLDMLYGFKIPLWRKKRLALRIYRNFARFIYEFLLLQGLGMRRFWPHLLSIQRITKYGSWWKEVNQ